LSNFFSFDLFSPERIVVLYFYSFTVWKKKVFERIEDSLELLLERNNSLSLRVSMSMSISILEEIWFKMLVDKALVVVESVLFANSLMDATIQDGGKRERSNEY